MSRRSRTPQPRRREAISPFLFFTGADPLDVTQAFASIRPLTSRIERFLSCFLSRKRMNIDQHTTTRVHARKFRSATITAILFWTAQASLCPCLSSPSTHGFFQWLALCPNFAIFPCMTPHYFSHVSRSKPSIRPKHLLIYKHTFFRAHFPSFYASSPYIPRR